MNSILYFWYTMQGLFALIFQYSMTHLQKLQGFTLQNKLFQWIRDRSMRLVQASGGYIGRNNSLHPAANNTNTENVLLQLIIKSEVSSISCYLSISVMKKVQFLKLYSVVSTAVRSNILHRYMYLHFKICISLVFAQFLNYSTST